MELKKVAVPENISVQKRTEELISRFRKDSNKSTEEKRQQELLTATKRGRVKKERSCVE